MKIKVTVKNENDYEFVWLYYGKGKFGAGVF